MKYGIEMTLKQLEEDPEAAALMDRVLPGIRARLGASPMAANLSLEKLFSYAKGMIPQEAVTALDAGLKKLGEGKGLTESEKRRAEAYRKIAEADETGRAERQTSEGRHHQDAIYPGQIWLDTNGNRIQAHGGAIWYENGVYYWYGENKEHSTGYPSTSIWTWGIRGYRSKDLCNWEDLGLIIPPDLENPDADLFPDMRVDRPHIRKCPATGKYVAWIKLSGEEACFLVMEANRFMGPYRVVRENYRPLGHKVGDFDIVTDEKTGKGYLFMDADHSGVICLEMDGQYHSCETEISWSYKGLQPPFTREGVALFERNGRKYMMTSGMTGYVPNQSDSAAAAGWTDEFLSIGDPNHGTEDDVMSSFNSQFTQIFRVPGRKDLYVALCDRWVPEYPVDAKRADIIRRAIGNTHDPVRYPVTEEEKRVLMESPQLETANTSIADYVWLPVEFVKDENGTDRPQITWKDSWSPDDYE